MTRVGLCLPQLGEHVTRGCLRTFCERAEELGYAGLWVQEHLYHPRRPKSDYANRPGVPVPPQYTTTFGATETLMAAAAWTERIGVGTSVLIGGYHRPVELAQRLSTLDVLSGGRLTVGFSVGWSVDEHEQSDVDFHTRGRRMDELVRAVLACWGPDPVDVTGDFFTIVDADVRPKPLQQPRPRLMSGMRSPAGLARTAELFDIWNPASGTAEQLRGAQAAIAGRRPDGLPPVDLYQRLFLEPPVVAPSLVPLGPHGVAAAVADSRAAGVPEVIVDASFWPGITSPESWAGLPDLLLPALEAGGERGAAPALAVGGGRAVGAVAP